MKAEVIPHEMLRHYASRTVAFVGGVTNEGPKQLVELPEGKYFAVQFDDFSYIAIAGSPDVEFSVIVAKGNSTPSITNMFKDKVCKQVVQKLESERLIVRFTDGSALWFSYKADDMLYLGNPVAAGKVN